MKYIKFIVILLSMLIYAIPTYTAEESFGGIGANLLKDSINKKVIIFDIIPNSPAQYAGLPIGAVIQQINGEKAKNLSLIRATSLIRGQIGTNVDLKIKYNGKNYNYSIPRAQIIIPEEKIDERYMIHWKQVVPNGMEKVKYVHPEVYKVLSRQEQEAAEYVNYWVSRETRFKNGYNACLSYPGNEQNTCLQNLVNREIAQTENDRQAELQEAMIEQQANQNSILRDINSSIRNNSNQLNNINYGIRNTNFQLNNINNSLQRW